MRVKRALMVQTGAGVVIVGKDRLRVGVRRTVDVRTSVVVTVHQHTQRQLLLLLLVLLLLL